MKPARPGVHHPAGGCACLGAELLERDRVRVADTDLADSGALREIDSARTRAGRKLVLEEATVHLIGVELRKVGEVPARLAA